jgi:hypothetical protein
VNEQRLTLKEAAERAGVSPSTRRRRAETGVIPEVGGNDHGITAAGAAHAHSSYGSASVATPSAAPRKRKTKRRSHSSRASSRR